MNLPDRYASSTFRAYQPQGESQEEALKAASDFVATIRRRRRPGHRLVRALRIRHRQGWKGLYLVGPVGTGKTHLLASMYNALHPEVPCAFLHSSTLFKATETPEAYADALARRYRVLCLDEVEIDDPANEARLIVVLKRLERRGVILLATSNVEPERFLSTHLGNDRFRRFLNEEFRRHYRVLLITGDDYRKRQLKPGRAWIGTADAATARLRAVFDADERRKRWLSFEEFVTLSSSTEHRRLMKSLAQHESLYLAGIGIRDTDDALRLLRVVDDLYQLPMPPVLYFSATTPPEDWLVSRHTHGLEAGISEKFRRTTSRLAAMCSVVDLRAAEAPIAADEPALN